MTTSAFRTTSSVGTETGAARALHILGEAAAMIWPGQRYVGTLAHIEGDLMVLDAVADAYGATGSATQRAFPVGLHVHISDTLQARDLGAGRTQSWADCQAAPNPPQSIRRIGLRSQISTHFIARGIVYIITIASLEPPSPIPFTPQDVAYIERIGSYLARQIEIEP
jgi:hypothetical protein